MQLRGQRERAHDERYELGVRARGSSLGRAIGDAFHRINGDILEATGGRLDLGTLAGLSFLTVGATEIAVSRRLPIPSWFNLAWWAFRTLTIFHEESEEESGEAPD